MSWLLCTMLASAACTQRPVAAAALLAGAVALLARELPYKLGLMLAALAGVLGGLWVESLGERPAQQGPA